MSKVLTVLFLILLTFSHGGLEASSKEKTRVLYILFNYPQISETYSHEELVRVWDDYEIQIVSLHPPAVPRKHFFPYTLTENVDAIIKKFKPHVMHTHWNLNAPLMEKLARKHKIPFTIRSHSLDTLARQDFDPSSLCPPLASRWCLRVLCFPATKPKLIKWKVPEEKVVTCWPVVNIERFYNAEKPTPKKRILNVGINFAKRNIRDFIDLAYKMRDSGYAFSLYITGGDRAGVQAYNEKLGNPVSFIGHVEPEEMSQVYQEHDWLIFTANKELNFVGNPVAIAEAQASGIGVCFQELPGRKEEQLNYLGGAGYLFQSIDELPEILMKPYPEEMRLIGLENCKKCDVNAHIHLLTDVWDSIR